MRDISRQHPTYQRMRDRWRMAHDFARGGQHVLTPDWQPTTGTMLTGSRAPRLGGGIGSPASESNPEVEQAYLASVSCPSYLWPHQRERVLRYEERCRRAAHIPLFQSVVNIYVGGVLRDGAQRDGVDERWQSIFDSIDGAGTDLDAYVRQSLMLGLTWGRVHTVTDAAPQERSSYGPPISTYCYLVSPIDLINWSVDEFGRWRWAVLREAAADEREPGDEDPKEQLYCYRVWYPDRWELWSELKGDTSRGRQYAMSDTGPNAAGEVPISTLWCGRDARVGQMDCESPLASTLDMDRHLLNKFSELDELERAQAFAILYVQDAEGETRPMEIGPWEALSVPPGSAPGFISPDTDIANSKWARIEKELWVGRQMSEVGRGKAEQSKEERSGQALTLELEERTNQMALWCKALEEYERSLYRMIAAVSGIPGEPPTVSYEPRRTAVPLHPGPMGSEERAEHEAPASEEEAA